MVKIFKLLWLSVFLALVCGATFFVFLDREYKSHHALKESVEVWIPHGTSLNRTAALLKEKGVIRDARLFVLLARLKGFALNLKAGEYAFSGSVSLQEILQQLANGDVIVRSLTIPEGKTWAEIKKIVYDNSYLEGEITLQPQEGEILPETYHFNRGEQRDTLLKKARQAMKKTLEEAYAGRDEQLPVKSAAELLVLASIVEKETGLKEERGRVASVFVNRLNLGMRLQTDPTVIYAVTNGEMNLGRPLYKKDLTYDSPYNTYLYEGLPPTPICSPGKEAIKAAAHPEKTPYLYFVADGVTGGHRFAKSLNEHNHNVALYRKAVK